MSIDNIQELLKIIKSLRESDMYIKDIFTKGGCYRFHLFLKVLYPKAIPYINQERNHVVTRVFGKYFDITGEVSSKYPNNFRPINKTDLREVKRWSFHKHSLLQITECPACAEPLCV